MPENEYLNRILHDIINIKQLTNEQLEYILNSSDDNKNTIIKIYNEIIIFIIESFIDND